MIDCFHRIRSLHKIGIEIHLHAFEYGRPHSQELNSLCSSVDYYPRDTTISRHFSSLPYSVVSRKSDQLLKNLLEDDYPVLFDGIQTTLCLDNQALTKRKKFVRLHNIEPRYYKMLARFENNLIEKIYYYLESVRLSRYENILKAADNLITVSIVDQAHYNSRFNNSLLIPSSHPYDHVESLKGKGEYILYHSDLSVNENVAVSEFLISEVFSKVPYRCIIAGKNPPGHLSAKISPYNNISLISNPDNERMDELIKNAHINVLPTMAANGLKLKLLISLFSGRHCLVNSTTINGSGLYTLCHIADTGEKMVQKIHSLMDLPFSEEMISERELILSKNNDNINNAKKLAELIFPE